MRPLAAGEGALGAAAAAASVDAPWATTTISWVAVFSPGTKDMACTLCWHLGQRPRCNRLGEFADAVEAVLAKKAPQKGREEVTDRAEPIADENLVAGKNRDQRSRRT